MYNSKEAEDDLTDFEKFGLQNILNLIQNFIVAAFTATDPSLLPQIEIIRKNSSNEMENQNSS